MISSFSHARAMCLTWGYYTALENCLKLCFPYQPHVWPSTHLYPSLCTLSKQAIRLSRALLGLRCKAHSHDAPANHLANWFLHPKGLVPDTNILNLSQSSLYAFIYPTANQVPRARSSGRGACFHCTGFALLGATFPKRYERNIDTSPWRSQTYRKS